MIDFLKKYFRQQIFSGFGHKIEIYIPLAEYPDKIEWIECASGMSTDLLALVICFCSSNGYNVNCSVKNNTSGFIWSDRLYNSVGILSVVIVPNSILSIKDGDDIEVTVDEDISCGLHLLYKTEATIVKVKDKKRSNPSNNDLGSNKNWLSPGSTSVNIEEGRSYPSISNLESRMKSLCLGSNTVTVEEESSRPSKRFRHLE